MDSKQQKCELSHLKCVVTERYTVHHKTVFSPHYKPPKILLQNNNNGNNLSLLLLLLLFFKLFVNI